MKQQMKCGLYNCGLYLALVVSLLCLLLLDGVVATNNNNNRINLVESSQHRSSANSQLPPLCPPAKVVAEGIIEFEGDESEWLIPGDLSDVSLGFAATKACCYSYIEGELMGIPQPVNFTRIKYINPDYSNNLFLYGYIDDDNQTLYKLNVVSCSEPYEFEPLFNITSLNNEVITTAVYDPTYGKESLTGISFMFSQDSIFVNNTNKILQETLPLSNGTKFYTGAFTLGVNGHGLDWVYIGRAVDNITAPAELIIYTTDDEYNSLNYNRTILLLSPLMNLQRPANDSFYGDNNSENPCYFYFHQFLSERAYHLANRCQTNITTYKYNTPYDAAAYQRIDYWPTTNLTVLLLTASLDESLPGFEVFLYLPLNDKTFSFFSPLDYPDIVYITESDSEGLPLTVAIFTHDPVTGSAVFFTQQLDYKVASVTEAEPLLDKTEQYYFDYYSNPPCCSGTNSSCLCRENEICVQMASPQGYQCRYPNQTSPFW